MRDNIGYAGLGGAAARADLDRAWRLAGWLIGLTIVFVRLEPWAYEGAWAMALALAAWRGFEMPRTVLPLAALLSAVVLGFWLSAAVVAYEDWHSFMWAGVSTYLAVTAFGIAVYVAEAPEPRLEILMRATVVAGVVAAVVATVGYASYDLKGGAFYRLLTSWGGQPGRAVGLFKDPNVYAAFMVFPIIVVMNWLCLARGVRAALWAGLLACLGAAMLLAMSRGAAVNLAVAVAVFAALAWKASPDRATRGRIVVGCIVGCIALAAGSASVLLSRQVRDQVSARAVPTMYYDVGGAGRMAGIRIAAEEVVTRPLGYGPLQFWKAYVERNNVSTTEFWKEYSLTPHNPYLDNFWKYNAAMPHNTYLNNFISGGWLSGAAYLALIGATLLRSWRALATGLPWWRTHAVLLAVLIGACGEGMIIDSDHWRHLFLLIGGLWGSAAHFNAERDPVAPAAEIREAVSAAG
jgi:hypothetical protein